MIKFLKSSLLGLLALAGAMSSSCSREQDPTKEIAAKVSLNAENDLVKVMASSQLIRDFARDCDKLTGDYEAALGKMSGEQRKAFYANDKLLTQHKSAPNYLVRTKQQMQEFNALQASRVKQIDAAFPEYAQMGDDHKAEVMSKVLSVISEGGTTSNLAGGCAAGYKSCMNGCASSKCGDACWAGYTACIAIMISN